MKAAEISREESGCLVSGVERVSRRRKDFCFNLNPNDLAEIIELPLDCSCVDKVLRLSNSIPSYLCCRLL